MQLVKTIRATQDGTYFGYGPASDSIIQMESVHNVGDEPQSDDAIMDVFDGVWLQHKRSYMYGGVIHISWKRVG